MDILFIEKFENLGGRGGQMIKRIGIWIIRIIENAQIKINTAKRG